MKNIYLISWCCIMACKSMPVLDPESPGQEIRMADSSMSALAAKVGFNTAVLQYADSTIVKLSEGKHPIVGIQTFAASFDPLQDIKTIAWVPQFAEVSSSGDLGYTWGTWKLNLPDTSYYGKYFTVWKKNKKGEWKVVLDGGNSSPSPGH